MSLFSIVASSSAFFLPASPPPNASSIDSDWSTKNKKQPGFLRLISAWYAMVFLSRLQDADRRHSLRDLRLSYTRGHRFECRDHPQNGATPGRRIRRPGAVSCGVTAARAWLARRPVRMDRYARAAPAVPPDE